MVSRAGAVHVYTTASCSMSHQSAFQLSNTYILFLAIILQAPVLRHHDEY